MEPFLTVPLADVAFPSGKRTIAISPFGDLFCFAVSSCSLQEMEGCPQAE